MKNYVILLSIFLLTISCKEYQRDKQLNEISKRDTLNSSLSTMKVVSNALDDGCDVSLLKNRKEYNSDKREASRYILWNLYRIQLLKYEEKSKKLGSNFFGKLNSGQKNLLSKEIDNLIFDLNESKNAILMKPKMEELQRLNELMYCYYLFSIENFNELKHIVAMSNNKDTITKNVIRFYKDPKKDDTKKMEAIADEFISIDKKYGLSK